MSHPDHHELFPGVDFGAVSDRGLLRPRNEDAYAVWWGEPRSRRALVVIADGMGGHRAGDVASRFATDVTRDEVARGLESIEAGEEALRRCLVDALQKANARIYAAAQEDPSKAGMGTTVTASLIAGRSLLVGHVGDSRAYLLRGDTVRQLTRDHSVVGELVRSGGLTEDEAREHPQRHVLTRALGVGPEVKVDVVTEEIRGGERLVLATDGLTSLVGMQEMRRLVGSAPSSVEAAQRLVDLANARGGPDNVTVLVVTFNPSVEGAV